MAATVSQLNALYNEGSGVTSLRLVDAGGRV